jgi:very-short-patch-repair endonuclease
LSREQTPAEGILWRELRGRRFVGFKFRRQHPIGPFFADVACHKCKLVVEVDGETHLGRESRDEERTKYLQAQGWLVLRFWNTQVYDDREGVLEVIYRACEGRQPPHPQPLFPEYGGEGGQRGGSLDMR